jgi:hypothetical protein
VIQRVYKGYKARKVLKEERSALKGSLLLIRWTLGPENADVQVTGQFAGFGGVLADWTPQRLQWCSIRREYVLGLEVPKKINPMVRIVPQSMINLSACGV